MLMLGQEKPVIARCLECCSDIVVGLPLLGLFSCIYL